MGKGIAIILMFLFPISFVLLAIWLITYLIWKVNYVLYALASIWIGFISLILIFVIMEPYLEPMKVSEKDIYGEYVIDVTKFSGKQANWQYDNFRFEFTEDKKMNFEYRVYEDNWKKEVIDISIEPTWHNRRVIIHSDTSNHHIIRDNPTLYRLSFNRFYYVFESEKFGNVFFKKGKWEK